MNSKKFRPIQLSRKEVNGLTGEDKTEYLFKILVIGELATGKTSFIKRYVHQYFSNQYRATVCCIDFLLSVIFYTFNLIVDNDHELQLI